MLTPRRWLIAALTLAAASCPPASAHAAHHKKHAAPAAPAAPKDEASAAKTLGSAENWTAYASEDKTGRVCYLVGHPKKSEPAGLARKPMAMVTHRPVENIANVVSFVEGYRLKEGSEVAVAVGDRKFELFTKDDSAWARTSELDKTIVTTLAKGKEAVVKGLPQKGPPTMDVYSLAGFAKTLGLIDKACGVQRNGAAAAPAHHRAKHRRHHSHHHR
ncbi:MAG: invasion associated locus B family protein [Thiohalocapsa sp.]